MISKFTILALFAVMTIAFAADCEFEGHQFNKGESHQPKGQCTSITCDGGNNLRALGCPAVAAPDSCKKIAEDPSKPYPQCCATYDCPK